MLRTTKHTGFTLLELLTYFFVASILLAAMILFLNSVLRQYVFISERVTIKKIASLITRSLNRDLQLTTPKSVHQAPGTLALQQLEAISDSGSYIWKDEVACYRYLPEDRAVLRWTTPTSSLLTLEGDPGSLQAIETSHIQALPNPSKDTSRVWSHVNDFQVEKTQRTLKVAIKLSLRDTKGLVHKHEQSQEIPLLNDEENI